MLNVLSRNNRFLFNVAEKSYFSLDVFWKELVLGAAQKYVGLNSYLENSFTLCCVGFVFSSPAAAT